MTAQSTNHLIRETSPYLLQHARNPVDWYPWGPEALARSRQEDKPILLSIGYSACHWCHVMEHESFEDEKTAELMNRHFINIKVDREERPDLDHIYQLAFQLFHRRGGGWPLTVFLTPDLQPFYAGTYFPPNDRYNLPGFPRVLESVADAYRTQHMQIRETADKITQALARINGPRAASQAPAIELVRLAVDNLSRLFEPVYGGFGGAPKFPATMALSLCLRHYHASHDRTALEMVSRSLQRMAEGGIYDQIGGGFHRYSVDDRWLVPHFEKMLYDNALLVRLYLDTHLVTRDDRYARVARGTLNYLLREMAHPDGGFYSAQDADSEGEEGKFFVWTMDDVLTCLGEPDGRLFCRAFDVTAEGNFEQNNILHVSLSPGALAEELHLPPEEVELRLEQGKAKLLAYREQRVKPARDEKILTSWNGLALSALAEAIKVFDLDVHRQAAVKTAEFIWNHLQHDGRLYRTWTAGTAKLTAYLDDYAFVAAAYLDLFEAVQNLRWFERAVTLTQTMVAEYWDDEHGDFFFTPHAHEPLISRPRCGHDQSIPSGTAVAAHLLLRLAAYTGQASWREMAERILRVYRTELEENPYGMASLLMALDFARRHPVEVVIAGPPAEPGTLRLLQQVHHSYLPNEVTCLLAPGAAGTPFAEMLVKGRVAVDGRPTAYVCRQMTCSPPITSPQALRQALVSSSTGD